MHSGSEYSAAKTLKNFLGLAWVWLSSAFLGVGVDLQKLGAFIQNII